MLKLTGRAFVKHRRYTVLVTSRDVRELRALEDTCLCLDSSNEERANIVDISVYEGAKRTADIPFGSFHEVSNWPTSPKRPAPAGQASIEIRANAPKKGKSAPDASLGARTTINNCNVCTYKIILITSTQYGKLFAF